MYCISDHHLDDYKGASFQGKELDIIKVKPVYFSIVSELQSLDVSCFAAARRSQAAGPGSAVTAVNHNNVISLSYWSQGGEGRALCQACREQETGEIL